MKRAKNRENGDRGFSGEKHEHRGLPSYHQAFSTLYANEHTFIFIRTCILNDNRTHHKSLGISRTRCARIIVLVY